MVCGFELLMTVWVVTFPLDLWRSPKTLFVIFASLEYQPALSYWKLCTQALREPGGALRAQWMSCWRGAWGGSVHPGGCCAGSWRLFLRYRPKAFLTLFSMSAGPPQFDRQQSWLHSYSSCYNKGNFVLATQKWFYSGKLQNAFCIFEIISCERYRLDATFSCWP